MKCTLQIFFLLIASCVLHPYGGVGQIVTDTTKEIVSLKLEQEKKFRYFRVGADISKWLASLVQNNYKEIEFAGDVLYKRNLFLAMELGTGNSRVQNEFLQYKSSNTFIRLGIDKTFFAKEHARDMDNAFVGFRYAFAPIVRKEAIFTMKDPIWGNNTGTIAPESFIAHWMELTGGFRLEVIPNIFVGWNIRVRTFLNPSRFEKLAPFHVAGYGSGEKATAFGYNFYILKGFGKR